MAVGEADAIIGGDLVVTAGAKTIGLMTGGRTGAVVNEHEIITGEFTRVRDFRGVKGTSFDGRGNYAMGLKEQIVFPEIEFDKVDEVLGMDIIIATTAKTDAEAKALLKHFNMPFNS